MGFGSNSHQAQAGALVLVRRDEFVANFGDAKRIGTVEPEGE
jgi:hypothetical protein